MRRYPEYKDSGIEWFGDIPYDWDLIKIKFIFETTMGQSPDSEKCNDKQLGFPFLQGKAEFGEVHPEPTRYCTEPKKMSKKNDILLSVRAPVGEMNISNTEYVIGRGLCALTPRNVLNEYSFYSLKTAIEGLKVLSTGSTFDAVSMDDIKNLHLVIPPINIQKRVANYLKEKTVGIDNLISDKEKLIELLIEKRQAIITKSVLEGLAANVIMKDSGVEWIGEVPEYWDVVQFKYCFNTSTGLSITRSELGEEGVHCIGYGPIHSRLGFDLDLKRDELTKAPYELFESKKSAIASENDFIFCDTSEDIDGSGNNVYVKDLDGNDLLAGSHTILARPIRKFESRFLAYLFSTKAWRSQIQSRVFGVKVYSITQQILNSTYVVLPSIEEQKEIIGYLDSKISIIDSVVNDIIIQVDKLKEYRQSIISEAVTGKVVV